MEFIRQHRRELILLWSFAIVIDFIMANDSYTHELFKHYDEAWFYMCGKAWMNGYVPYVDFADSKGPLLWLIYGLGYILSPTTYVGVWWLSIPVYLFCFTYCYKTALLFTDRRHTMLATMMMCVPYFTGFHFEMRCEDWCQPAVIYGIYRLSMAIKDPDSALRRRPAFILGACITACLMIKWTIAAMTLTLPFAIACIAASRQGFRRYATASIAGMATAITPFAAIFLHYGNFGDFIREYFINTTATMNSQGFSYVHELILLFTTMRIAAVLMFAGTFIVIFKYGRRGWWMAGCALAFVLLAAYHDHSMYYQAVTNSFAIFCAISAALWFKKIFGPATKAGITVSAFILIVLMSAYAYRLHPSFIFSERPETFYHACRIIDRGGEINAPKVLNYKQRETGVGINANTLPATKYWASQGGATDEMEQDQDKAIHNRLPDFIITNKWHINSRIFPENGYKMLTEFIEYDDTLFIFSRHEIPVPDSIFHPSIPSRLLKRGFRGY